MLADLKQNLKKFDSNIYDNFSLIFNLDLNK